MTPFSLSSNPSYFFIFSLLALISHSAISLHQNPNFESEIAFSGAAKLADGGSSVQLNRPTPLSSGLLIRNKPFRFIQFHSSRSSRAASFSSSFTFSMSPQNGDGIALVIVPLTFPSKFTGKGSFGLSRKNRFLAVEFANGNPGDRNANYVRIDVGGLVSDSARVSNVSKIDLALNSGVKLVSSIDYHAILKRLHVRLSKLGDPRPDEPLLTYPIDLGEMWKEEEVYLGLVSSSGNSLQTTTVFSWSSKVEDVPKWLHSQPINPRDYVNDRGEQKTAAKKSGCLYGFFFGVGCGALTALALVLLWTIFVDMRPMIQGERPVCPVNFRYEKINVVVENSSEVAKK